MATTYARTYSELMTLKSYGERLKYLQTFNRNPSPQERKLMNSFYKSGIWKRTRNDIIKRDLGCDLGIHGLDIEDVPLVHHINPISLEDVWERSPKLFDPENLITVSYDTHNKIHYNREKPISGIIERRPGDTKLWEEIKL